MMTIQHRKNKRGLQQLSDAQKMEAITKVQKGETKAAVAREFGVPESTLRGWCKKAKVNNGNIHAVMNKSLQVTSTMSPVLMTPEMAYRDCSYSKGSGSDEGSTNHPFSDEQEDEDLERDVKPAIVIPEERRRVLDWLNYGHYPQIPAAQTPPPRNEKPAQPVVTSSTCDDTVKCVSKAPKVHKKNKTQNVKGSGFFYNWCKTKPTCEGYSSSVSPISPASSDKNDSYDDKPLALIVPSKRRLSDFEASLKNLNKMYHVRHDNNENNINNNNSLNPNYYNNNIIQNINVNSNTINNNRNVHNENDDNRSSKQILSVEEALQHGEVFLDWLKASSDPNVTVFQAMQIGTLIKNIRSSLERNQNRR